MATKEEIEAQQASVAAHQQAVAALTAGWPGAQWTLAGEDYAGLLWLDETIPKPTEEEFSAAVTAVREAA
jgi:hypothetical protein